MPKNKNIVKASFTSVWDDSCTSVECSCKVNLMTREILAMDMKHREVCSADDGIGPDNVDDAVGSLDEEYVEINGVRYPACQKDDLPEGDTTTFWYA